MPVGLEIDEQHFAHDRRDRREERRLDVRRQEPDTSVSFSVTVCRARSMSWPQSNSTQTTATPTAVAERTRRTPAAPFSADSIGKVTSDSISSGSMPGASARMVTVGAVRSGKHVQRDPCGGPAAPHEKGRQRAPRRCARWLERPANECVNHLLGSRSSAQCTCPCAGTDVDSDASRTR